LVGRRDLRTDVERAGESSVRRRGALGGVVGARYPLGAAATLDADVFRVFVRRIGLLDSTRVLDSDVGMQRRIEQLFGELLATPRPAAGPPRDEMLAASRAAAKG
jgi:hypothetical protein